MSPTGIGEADEYLLWENVEPVYVELARNLVPRQDNDPQLRKGLPTPPFDAAKTLDGALADYCPWARRLSVSTKERAASNGAYTSLDCEMYLPVQQLAPTTRLQPRDALIDRHGTRWVILEAELMERVTWRLVCRDLLIAYQLRDVVNIERPAISFDAAGAIVTAWPTGPEPRGGEVLYPNLACRVQEVSAPIAEERGIRGTERRYEVYVSRQVRVTMTDRVVWAGNYLEIENTEQAGLIGELPKITVKLSV